MFLVDRVLPEAKCCMYVCIGAPTASVIEDHMNADDMADRQARQRMEPDGEETIYMHRLYSINHRVRMYDISRSTIAWWCIMYPCLLA